jgi:hypothetical protein
MYELLNNSNLSWECEKCGMPNFATTFFNSTIETSNSLWDQVHIISADARIQPDIMLIKVKQVRSSSLGLLKGAE